MPPGRRKCRVEARPDAGKGERGGSDAGEGEGRVTPPTWGIEGRAVVC